MSLLTEALAGGAGLVPSGMSSDENSGSHSGLKPCPTSCSHPPMGQCLLKEGFPQAGGWNGVLLLQFLFVLFSD